MVLTPSTMLSLGTKAPSFSLPDTNGNTVSLADLAGAPALVALPAFPSVFGSYAVTLFTLIFFYAFLGQAWNVVGGYAVTDRMLAIFRRKDDPPPAAAAPADSREGRP